MTSNTTSSHAVSIKNKIRYASALISTNARAAFGTHEFNGLRDNIREYERLYAEFVGGKLADARVLEIGFGQRPLRVFTLASLGIDVRGVDIEQPTLSIGDITRVIARNGLLRMLKGAVRFLCFDQKFYSDYKKFLRTEFSVQPKFEKRRLIVADSADAHFWKENPGPYDFIYSEDVFEHIPAAALPNLIDRMAENMSNGGIALVRPMVFTGICGGHHIDWYAGTFGKAIKRETPAWDHLLDNSHEADTYLNKVTRSQYRQMFEKRFEVLRDVNDWGELGREFLTVDLRNRLLAYDEYELFSNNVCFVLRKKS